MSKRDQLLELLKNIAVFSRIRGNKILERFTVQDCNTPHSCDYRYSPNNGKFSDICKLLELEGFSLDRITGSHHIFKRNDVILVIPVHNKKVKSVYIRRVLEIIGEK